MYCITINGQRQASNIFECDETILTKHYSFQTFISEDVERLQRIKDNYKPSESPTLTPVVIDTMKQLRLHEEFGKLREMIKRYLNIEACCESAIDRILATL